MARASLVRSSLAWLHVLSSGPCTACGLWSCRPQPLGSPAKTQGRNRDAVFNVVSFKPERAFKVIAHVRDWEHAETVRRRCLRTVRGFALHAECMGPGRHVGESAPGPTGLTWASELSEPRHAQAERPPTERSEARVCLCQRQESLGANPRTGFRQVPLMLWLVAGTRGTALVLGWL